jgi:RNA polymerase sigma-70 factor, ECF subfamily
MTARASALEEPPSASPRAGRDDESTAWVRALGGTGPERDEAVERLHALLLRAAATEVTRRRASAGGAAGDLDDLVTQAANDTLMASLSKLPTFRGDSRFTTWAYKFALLEAAAAMRRRPWHGRELPLEAEGWARLPHDGRSSPAGQAEAS